MVICMERGADLHMAQLMPLPLTVSCFIKIHIGFTFLVPAHPGSSGQRAVKRVCVRLRVRVCVCVSYIACNIACNMFTVQALSSFVSINDCQGLNQVWWPLCMMFACLGKKLANACRVCFVNASMNFVSFWMKSDIFSCCSWHVLRDICFDCRLLIIFCRWLLVMCI